jgi:hypothetical protein
MAANQRNFQYFTYVDDNGTSWNKKGVLDAAVNALDGSAALTSGAPVWEDGGRFRTRKATFLDGTTGRTVEYTIYTAAAFSALTSASTLAVSVPGEATAVTYTLSRKTAEKQPIGATITGKPDHA